MKRNNIDARILYEDNHLIIVNKQPSEIVQGDKTGDEPLSEIIKTYIKEKYDKPGEVFLGVVHRLDRPVSGAVIFARTSKALTRLNNMLRDGEIHKTYWAVVKTRPAEPTGHLVNFLTRNEKQNKSYVHDHQVKGSQRAELTYTTVCVIKDYSLLEINLMTGRHHQIRSQLAAIGCPIRGDLKYGYPRSNPDGAIHLHARCISFVHPVQKTTLSVIAGPPRDPLWYYFAEAMNREKPLT